MSAYFMLMCVALQAVAGRRHGGNSLMEVEDAENHLADLDRYSSTDSHDSLEDEDLDMMDTRRYKRGRGGKRGGGYGGSGPSRRRGCFAGSTQIIKDGVPTEMKNLTVGDHVRVVKWADKVENLVPEAIDADLITWAHIDPEWPSSFVRIDTSAGSVSVTEPHYVLAKKDEQDTQAQVEAWSLKVGWLLPRWVSEVQAYTWVPITALTLHHEVGLYMPLLSASGIVVTAGGICVPAISEDNQGVIAHPNSTMGEEETNDSPEEDEEIYKSWLPHYLSLKWHFPCLFEVPAAEDGRAVVIILFQHYFEKHPHDVKDSVDPEHFIEWVKNNTASVVGEKFASHLPDLCPDLFK